MCTIGGNVANNSGGPHCLAYGVTNAHVRAIEVVLPDGQVADARAASTPSRPGSTCGACSSAARAPSASPPASPSTDSKNRPAVRTLLLSFDRVRDAAATVSAVIAAGIVPAAMEVMDQRITVAVENYVHAGYPTDAAARSCSPRSTAWRPGSAIDAERIAAIGREHGATACSARRRRRRAGSCCGRGARPPSAPSPRSPPTTTCTTPWCPGRSWPTVLDEIYDIAERHGLIVMNVFHAGDGNLHPLLLFDGREPGRARPGARRRGRDRQRPRSPPAACCPASTASASRSRRTWRACSATTTSTTRTACAGRSTRRAGPTPARCCPMGHSCADIQALRRVPTGVWG